MTTAVVPATSNPDHRGDSTMGAPLSGRRVALERLRRQHLPVLYEIATSDGLGGGWPLRGRTIDPAAFETYLWQQSSVQFAIVRRDSGAPIGLVQGVSEDLRSGTVDIAVVVAPRLWRAGWPLEGVVLFADYLFSGLGYRKLYFSMPASVRRRVGRAADALLTLECTLSRHVLVDGDYQDLSVFSLHRDRWDTTLLSQVTGRIVPAAVCDRVAEADRVSPCAGRGS